MFEQRSGGWNYTWTGIIGVVIIVVAVVQIFKVNPPDRAGSAARSQPVWTQGEVFSGRAEVPGGTYLSYPINLNRRATFLAFFTTGRNDRQIPGTLIKAENFNMWKSGDATETVVTTGPVPRGTINRVLEPGSYLFILDNRSSGQTIALSHLRIGIE